MADLKITETWGAEQVARYLGRSKSWVYWKVRQGELPHVRISEDGLRFIPYRLQEWLEARERAVAG